MDLKGYLICDRWMRIWILISGDRLGRATSLNRRYVDLLII